MKYAVIKTVKGTICKDVHSKLGDSGKPTANVNDAYRCAQDSNDLYKKEGCGCKAEVKEIDE